MVHALLAFTLVTIIGCMGSGDTITSPSADQPDPPALTGSAQSSQSPGEASPGHALMGYWNCVVDSETGVVEFVPLRTSEYHFNMVPILEGTMGLGLASPPAVIDGALHVDISLSHPFADKLQLSGFDVKGILISEGSEAGFGDPDIRIAGPHETRLLNADGFTRWWNPGEFIYSGMTGYSEGKLGSSLNPAAAAILNGYKLFADDFGMDAPMSDLDPATRAFFEAGNSNSRHYEISLASGMKFNYAVDCSWAAPDPSPPVDVPDDFPPEANQLEPWFIEVTETNNTLWYANAKHGGNVNYEIVVHDWQGVDDFGALTFECPGLFSQTASVPDSVTEFTASYHFDIVLPNLISADPLDVLVTVDVPGTYDPLLTGVDKPLRGYHRHISIVSDTDPIFNMPPVAIMEATTETEVFVGETISFDASDSYDLDGYIADYLWDFNGDGVYGDTYTGDPETPTHTYILSGEFQVKVKVVDNSTGSDNSDPVDVLVTLDTNDPPVAIAEATTSIEILEDETVSFDGSESYDLDGEVVEWKWDFDGDGDFNDAYEGEMQTPTALFPNPGTYFVNLKVIDNESGWGVLDDKIEIEVEDIPNVLPIAVAISTTATEIDACGTVTFDASGSYDTDGAIVDYQWDFDGDGVYDDLYDSGTDLNPTKYYGTYGVWDVDLKVIDDEGGEDTLDEPITVTATNVDPVAIAVSTTSTEILTFESVTFDAADSYDPDCDHALTYEWDFDGDGTFDDPYDSGNDMNPTKIFSVQGEFNVFLRVSEGLGGSNETDTPIVVTVSNHPPVSCAEITSDWPNMWETDIEFSGSCSSDYEGPITLWEWDLDADGTYEKTGEVVTYYFATAGDYQMQLRVTDGDAETDLLDVPLEFHVFDDTNIPPTVTDVIHSRTTSQKNSTTETVELSVEFVDPVPVGDTHTYLWMCDYGYFDDETSATPTWYPPDEVVECDITARVIDAEGYWDEGTCRQWVCQYAIIPGNTQGMLPNGTLYSFDPDVDLNLPGDVLGTVAYFNFWSTTCPPCKAELPDLTEVYDHYYPNDEYNHIMASNKSQAEQEGYLNSYDYRATYWCVDSGWSMYSKTLPFGNSGYIPWHLIFDRDGHCRWVKIGSVSSANQLIVVIDQLL